MITPVENWGQLKLIESPDAAEGEEQAQTQDEPHDAAPSTNPMLQLLTLPKMREHPNGEAAVMFVPSTIIRIPIAAIANASGTTKNDLTLALRPGSLATSTPHGSVELSSIRFAIPNVCVGYEDTEEAGKVILHDVQTAMQRYQSQQRQSHPAAASEEDRMLRLATMSATATAGHGESDGTTTTTHTHDGSSDGSRSDETVVAVFDDTTLSYPAGKFKVVVSNYNVVLEDKKRGAAASGQLIAFPLTDIQQLYLCDVPASFAKSGGNPDEAMGQYVVLILRNPIKIRTTKYAHVVISCPPYLVLDEDHPWRSELTTQEALNRALHFRTDAESTESSTAAAVDYPLTPTLSGKVSEILIRVFKATAKVPAYGGINKEYRSVLTQQRHCCMRCLYHSTEGLLYVVNGGFLFLHRPATKIGFAEMDHVEMDEAESGSATFQLAVFVRSGHGGTSNKGGLEKHIFSGIDKAEKEGLLRYLAKKVKLIRRGLTMGEDSGEDEDEEEEEADGNGEDDEDEDSESDANSSASGAPSESESESASDADGDEDDEGTGRRRAKHSEHDKKKTKKKHGRGGSRDGDDAMKTKRHHRHHHKRSRHDGDGDADEKEGRRHKRRKE